MNRYRPDKIVSGGQTGADRGALKAALHLGIPVGGWCPRGRRAEDGMIPAEFSMNETDSDEYSVRTRLNVRDSAATILFTRGEPSGGSALTKRIAIELGRPFLHLDLATLSVQEAAKVLQFFLSLQQPGILNVAGSRESGAKGIGELTQKIVFLACSSPME